MTPDKNPHSERLLEQADNAFRSGRAGYRDAMVRTGRLLRDYVSLRLSEGDGLSEGARRKAGACRGKATRDAADRLGTTNDKVNELIRVAVAADLLSGGRPVVNLTYAAVRCFRAVIYRPGSGLRCRRSLKDVGAIESSGRARWEVRPEYAGRAEALFREADAGGWGEKRVAAAIRELRGVGGVKESPREEPGRGFDPEAMARNSSPRDLADWVARVVGLSVDPPTVMRLVEERLAAMPGRRSSWGTYGEED